MSDIRKRTGKKGTTYQVRYPSKATKSGYAFKSFVTLKEAKSFVESGAIRRNGSDLDLSIRTVSEAIDRWLKICEKEGTDKNEPVTKYTLKAYRYHADLMTGFDWGKPLQEITTPDVVEFRSWLLSTCPSRGTARKTLSYFHSALNEMALRGHIPTNPASGVSIRAESRYDEPVTVPSKQDVVALLKAADELAQSSNQQTARTWARYRPILYLAADSGMRPQEYLALSKSAIRDGGVYVDRAVEGGSARLSVTKTRAGRRFIELSPFTYDLVKEYAESAPQNRHDLAFPTSTGKWQCPRNWRRRGFNAACLHARLVEREIIDGQVTETPKYRPYDLRHFYASMLFEKKVNLKKIQTLMGHSKINTTLDTYGHLIEDAYNDVKPDTGILGLLS